MPKTKKDIIGQGSRILASSLYLDRLVAEYHTCNLSSQVLNLPHFNFFICKLKITVVPSSLIYSEDLIRWCIKFSTQYIPSEFHCFPFYTVAVNKWQLNVILKTSIFGICMLVLPLVYHQICIVDLYFNKSNVYVVQGTGVWMCKIESLFYRDLSKRDSHKSNCNSRETIKIIIIKGPH